MGLTTSVSGNHSIRFRNKWMWITPSGISRYKINSNHLVKVHLRTSKAFGNIRPSIELNLHRNIYNTRQDVNAIVHTHSPFTIGVSISSKFQHVIEIGRASCRGKSVDLGGRRIIKKKKD